MDPVSVDYIEQVLKVLARYPVISLKTAGLEIVLSSQVQDAFAPQPASDPTAKIAEVIKKQEESLPPDLRADDLMNADKAMFWSSPDGQGEPMPLAGEQEL